MHLDLGLVKLAILRKYDTHYDLFIDELRQAVINNDYTRVSLALKAPRTVYDLEQAAKPDGVTLVMICAQCGRHMLNVDKHRACCTIYLTGSV